MSPSHKELSRKYHRNVLSWWRSLFLVEYDTHIYSHPYISYILSRLRLLTILIHFSYGFKKHDKNVQKHLNFNIVLFFDVFINFLFFLNRIEDKMTGHSDLYKLLCFKWVFFFWEFILDYFLGIFLFFRIIDLDGKSSLSPGKSCDLTLTTWPFIMTCIVRRRGVWQRTSPRSGNW